MMVSARLACLSVTAALVGVAPVARAQTPPPSGAFEINRSASLVGFTISGSMLFKVTHDGRFNDFTGTVEYDPFHPADTQVDLTVFTASVDTKDAKDDALLRSRDFF